MRHWMYTPILILIPIIPVCSLKFFTTGIICYFNGARWTTYEIKMVLLFNFKGKMLLA